jgi:hypothetical protein
VKEQKSILATVRAALAVICDFGAEMTRSIRDQAVVAGSDQRCFETGLVEIDPLLSLAFIGGASVHAVGVRGYLGLRGAFDNETRRKPLARRTGYGAG